MIQNYFRLVQNCKNIALGVFLAIGSVGTVSAQLSGSYTIDPSAASSSSNYSSLAAFATALNNSGVSGAVTATVKGSENVTNNVVFRNISGVSATNTITIEGGGYTYKSSVANEMGLTTSASNAEVIRFSGADYITIKNYIVENTNTSTNGRIIRFEADVNGNSSDYNNILNCTLQFSGRTTGTTSAGAYVVFGSSLSATITSPTVNMGRFTVIKGNLMRTTNTNSPGPAFGICENEPSAIYTGTISGNEFVGNTIQNFYYYGIYMRYTHGNVIDGNDISRANATSNNGFSSLYGIYSFYGYAVTVTKNRIHDLPFAGVTSMGGANYIYGIAMNYSFNSSTRKSKVESNRIDNNKAYFYFYGINLSRNNAMEVSKNIIVNNYNYLYYFYALNASYDTDAQYLNNRIDSNENGGYYFYGMQIAYPIGTNNQCNDNRITYNKNNNSSSGYGLYGINMYNYSGTSNWKIDRNAITYNEALGYTYSSFYGIYMYYYLSGSVSSNLIAQNAMNGYDYCIYFYTPTAAYKKSFYQNTIQMSNARASYAYSDHNGFYGGNYGGTELIGNIIMLTNSYSCSQMYIYGNSLGLVIDNNSYFDTLNADNYWYNPNGSGANFAAWMNTSLPGKGERFLNHRFRDMSKLDFRSDAFENQNNVSENSLVANDINLQTRNLVKNDRGAMESYMDLELVRSAINLPAVICSGYETSGKLTIKNKYIDTAYNFNIAYSINGAKPVTALVTNKILAGDTAVVSFTSNIRFDAPGDALLKVFIQLPDDNKSNDTLTYKTKVLPAPGGSVRSYSAKSTKALYQFGKAFDVTIANEPVIFDFTAPRAYTNGGYGTDWTASSYVLTDGGRTISGSSVAGASSSANAELTFITSDSTLEDSFVTVCMKFTDLNNGCDTTIKRRVLIYPSAKPNFVVPARICDGDAILFENRSNVKSGSLEFFWDFGTGLVADTSNAPEPVFQFSKSGKYKVKLTAITLPYGFVFSKIIDVDVNAIPTIAFDKVNACLGQDLEFTNRTSPLTAKMSWDFGNGATANTTNAKYKYSKAGTYLVTLSADLNGCVAKLTQKVYQFEKPIAKFTLVSGTCDNDEFAFANQSTIGSGLLGTKWNFDDNGSVSTDFSPVYEFSKPGKKNVKVIASSEFGCLDSMIKEIEVRESPKAGFTNTPACSLTPTVFTNTTADVSGAIANYTWNFGDGTTSKTKSPKKSWNNLGPKKVTLLVTLDNGCKAEVNKDLSVLTQPKASFVASDVCAGDQVIFANNTTWPQGDISYNWDFGDNTYSNNSDPSKLYNIVQTTSYNVTLYAYIAGGCADSVTQRVTINETPRTCDFKFSPDYAHSFYGIRVEPVNGSGVSGGQNNVDYTWIFATGGTLKSKDVNAAVSYDLQFDGEYEVTMKAVVRQTGCECSKTKKVVMNRAAVKDLQSVGVAVYPSPTAGDIKVATTETFGANITVNVMSIEGKMVSTKTVANEGVMVLSTDGLSNGVYLVQVMSGDKQVTKKITVQR
ncbi:MAG: PKD domain-containing protein [Sphingomonadales bacterium]|nr:PKD domain-containing protein [Sphingomonadales bacterium]